MMIIQFNSLGVITSVDTSNASFRQGSKGEVIQAVFAGKSNSTHTAKINFTRPDGTVVQNLVMSPDPSNQSAFLFELDDLWFLAISGNATMTIFLYNASNVIQAQGQATIPIESSDYIDEDDVPITTEQYDSLLALVSSKANNSSAVIVVDDIDDLDMTQFGVNQLFYVISKNQFMQLVENELEEKELKVYDLVPGQQATMSIIANTLTNVNGRVLSAYESQIVIVNDFQCYKITRGGENLTEEYASRYMEIMTGSKYLPKYDYEHPQNTYFITPSGLILKPQYDSTNGLLLYPMSNLATRDYVDNDILEITDTATPLTYEQRQKILTNNVHIKYNNFYYEKINHLGHNVRFECADVLFKTNTDGSTTISKRFIIIRDDTGSIVANTRELDTYSKAQADQHFANNVEMSVDSNYVLKVKLIDKNGSQLAEDSVDLPLESIVQSAQYYETYTYQGTTYEDVIVITLATTEVPTIIPVGDLVSGLVSENTFNQGMATKVDKTNVANKVYGTNGNGLQTTFNVDSNVSGNVVRRDSNSQIKVPLAPTDNNDATSKDYVDTFAKDLALSLDQSTYVLTVTLKNTSGGNIVSRNVDLPLETMVVSGSYDENNKAIVLVLKNGQTISIPVGDLISGLVSTDYLQANYYNKTQIDQMVAGFVFADVDDHLSSASTNPVENRVIAQALEEKANVDGNYPTMTVGVANELSPYDESSGNEQDTPFSFQATGTANGTQPDFSTGEFALLKEKRGNTVVVNQKFPSTEWGKREGTVTVTDGETHFVGNDNTNNKAIDKVIDAVIGHKYLIWFDYKSNQDFSLQQVNGSKNISASNTYQTRVYLETGSGSPYIDSQGKCRFYWYSYNANNNNWELYLKNIFVVDLTQWFNGDIPQDILDNPDHFFRYYQGSLAYNEGTLVNANGRYIKCIGMNQFDEENYLINQCLGSDGTNTYSLNNYITLGKFNAKIKVIPNSKYKVIAANYVSGGYVAFFDKDGNNIGGRNYFTNTITTLSYAYYMLVSIPYTNNGTYNNDISINLYYEDESRCLTYEPYKVLTNNDTGVEILRKAGNVCDIKKPDGTIIRNVGVVDLGSLEWAKDNNWDGMFATSGIQTTAKKLRGANLLSKIYINSGFSSFANMPDMTAQIFDSGAVYCKNLNAYSTMSALEFKQAMSGVLLFYELETPTTEQGTSFSENLEIDDFGSMDFGGTNGVPQGANIFYPVDYKAFVDTLYKYTDGTPNNIALKSDVASEQSAREIVDTQLLNAVGGTLRQCLCVKESLDFDNTAFVDLGELSWNYDGTHKCFVVTVVDTAGASGYQNAKALSTLYTITGANNIYNNAVSYDMKLGIGTDHKIYISNQAYTDATAFKNAMKGVLVAYEKASS